MIRLSLELGLVMDLNKLDIFRLTNSKMGWLSERQTVLAQNIANADIVFISVTIARYLFNAKMIARELVKELPNTKIYLGGLGTRGIVDGELQEGIHLANKDTLRTLNKL